MVNEERLRREREVFEACLTMPPDKWSDYLGQVCAGNSALRKRVERLLASHQRADQSTHSKFALPPSIARSVARHGQARLDLCPSVALRTDRGRIRRLENLSRLLPPFILTSLSRGVTIYEMV